MAQPQPVPYYPPLPPQKKGLSDGMIIAIVVVVVVVVAGIVAAIVTGGVLNNIQQASNLSHPNVAVTDYHGTYNEDCGYLGSGRTTFELSATLANTGGAGFVDIGFNVNGQQVRTNTYHINANTDLPIDETFTLNECYGSSNPTYAIVILAERSA